MANDINWKHWQKKDGSLRANAPAHVVEAHKHSLAMWENAATTAPKSELSSAYRSGRTFDQSGNLIDKVAGEPQAAARPNFTRPGISSDLPNVPAVHNPSTAVVPVSPAVSHAQAPQGPSIKDAYVGSGSAARSGITDAERATLRTNLEKRISTSPWKMPIGEGAKQLASKVAPAASLSLRGAGVVGGLMSANEALKADNWGDRVYHGVNALAGGLTGFGPTMGAGIGLGLANNAIRAFTSGNGPSEANGAVDPNEVARQVAERKAATPAPQMPATEALPDRSLGQLIAGRANNMDRLQGEVLRAKDTLSDAQANTMALAPLGGHASAVDAIINPMRMAAHTQQERAGLQRAMGEYGMAQKAQGHDDTTALKQEEITMQHALAMARLKADQTQRAQERIDKAVPFTVENPKTGMQEPDQAGAAMYRRNADSLGLAAVTDPAQASQVANKVMLNTTMARNAGANDPYAGTSDGDIQFANTPNNGLRTASLGDWFQRGDGVTLGDIAMNRKVYGLKSAQGTRMHSSRSLANGDQSVMTYADQLAEAARAKSGGK